MAVKMNLQKLHELVDTPNELGASGSTGLDWIMDYAQEFMYMLRNNKVTLTDFFSRHTITLDPYWVIQLSFIVDEIYAETVIRCLQPFTQIDQPAIYKWWRQNHHDDQPAGLRNTIEQFLRQGLKQSGWVFAKVESHTYHNKQQLKVRYHGITYIKDSGQRLYNDTTRPEAGDIILFKPDDATNTSDPHFCRAYFHLGYRP